MYRLLSALAATIVAIMAAIPAESAATKAAVNPASITWKKVLVMGFQPAGPGKETEGQMAYFTPDPKDPNAKWIMHPISEPSSPGKEIPGTRKFSHGLGVGDLNSDGKNDVMCTAGWWE